MDFLIVHYVYGCVVFFEFYKLFFFVLNVVATSRIYYIAFDFQKRVWFCQRQGRLFHTPFSFFLYFLFPSFRSLPVRDGAHARGLLLDSRPEIKPPS